MNVMAQLPRAWAVCKKDIKVYYFKGPVLVYGPVLPGFLFLAFYVGRNLTVGFLIPGLIAMTMFFTATAVGPLITPWETRMRVLERLVGAPISLFTILLGDAVASLIFGLAITLVPLFIGVGLGMPVQHAFILTLGLIIAGICFSYIGLLFSAPPADIPGNVMMLSALVKFPLIFISGIFVPLRALPHWGQVLAFVSPLTYFTDLVRYSLGGGHYLSITVDLLALVGFTLLITLAAVSYHRHSLPRRFT